MRTVQFRLVWAGFLLLALASPMFGAKEMRLKLLFTPKENVTANLPVTDKANPAKLIEVQPLRDARSLPDLSVVGENREERKPKPVRTTSSVADFATEALKKCLYDWGVRLGQGQLVLAGEITNLFVTEENTYSTAVNIRFRLQDQAGKVLWEGIVAGDAHQWGRSFSEENYNEQISDALKRTFANLVSNPGFEDAWAGKASPAPGEGVTPADLRARILEMMKAGIGEDVIVSYVRAVRLTTALTTDQILEWKRVGIADPVIRAAVEQK